MTNANVDIQAKCCDVCNCDCDPNEPQAVYWKGTFSGLVTTGGFDGTWVCLHEIGGSLDGPSHVVSDMERTLSCRAHSNAYPELPGVITPHCEVMRSDLNKNRNSVNGDKSALKFTARHPLARMAFFDSVRSGDEIFVKVGGEVLNDGKMVPALEGFPCTVHAIVPTTGALVVYPLPEKLRWLDIDMDAIYTVPYTAVLELVKGENWDPPQ